MSGFVAPPQQVPQQQQYPLVLPTLDEAVAKNELNTVKRLLENGASVNERNNDGVAPLQIAITRKNPDMVSLLLENGANVNELNRYGNTPLHFVNVLNWGHKNPEISKLLLEKGADMTLTDARGRTPLDLNPRLTELNREVQAQQAQQNFEVRKPLIQLSQGTDTSSSPRTRYLQNEFVARDVASYLDRNTKGGKYKRKSRKSRKSKKSRKSRKSRKYRR
jgi:ankyrin repeat protein